MLIGGELLMVDKYLFKSLVLIYENILITEDHKSNK